jgi:hypothetical protein
MENFIAKGDERFINFPDVIFNASTGACSIQGKSSMEDAVGFYEPAIAWIERYCQEVKKPLHLSFNLNYYNTSSSKVFQSMLSLLKDYQSQGGEVSVKWYYPKEDESIAEEAEDMQRFIGLDIEIIPLGD